MNDLKGKIAVGIGAAGLVWGVTTSLAPPSRDDGQRRDAPGTAQDIGDLADVDEQSKNRMRDESNDLVDAENDQKNRSSEHRSPEKPQVRIRIR